MHSTRQATRQGGVPFPPDPNPHKPRLVAPPGSWDSHFHIFGSPAAPIEHWLRISSAIGIDRGGVVMPGMHGSDPNVALDAIARADGRIRGMIRADSQPSTTRRASSISEGALLRLQPSFTRRRYDRSMSTRMLFATLALLATTFGLATATAAAPLRVDRDRSVAGFTIKHLFLSRVHGTMKIVSVDMPLKPDSVVPLSVDAVIDVGSVNTSERDRDSDLRSSDWFNVERYPTMHFVSSHVDPLPKPNQFRVTGTLSLHGVSRDVTLDVTASSAKRDEHGVVHRAYTATANFDRRDFGLDAYTSGGGTLLVGTGVAVTINLEMIEAE
jgi:polyisoprenoid-binding protein YceI